MKATDQSTRHKRSLGQMKISSFFDWKPSQFQDIQFSGIPSDNKTSSRTLHTLKTFHEIFHEYLE
jgi:hypothetical protein